MRIPDSLAPGAKVVLDDGNIRGTVISVLLDGRGVSQVEVVWYDDGVRYCEWCDPGEVEPAED